MFGSLDGWMDRWVGACLDLLINGKINGLVIWGRVIGGWTGSNGLMDESLHITSRMDIRLNRQLDVWIDRWIAMYCQTWMHGCFKWMIGYTGGQTDGWMDGWINGLIIQ